MWKNLLLGIAEGCIWNIIIFYAGFLTKDNRERCLNCITVTPRQPGFFCYPSPALPLIAIAVVKTRRRMK